MQAIPKTKLVDLGLVRGREGHKGARKAKSPAQVSVSFEGTFFGVFKEKPKAPPPFLFWGRSLKTDTQVSLSVVQAGGVFMRARLTYFLAHGCKGCRGRLMFRSLGQIELQLVALTHQPPQISPCLDPGRLVSGRKLTCPAGQVPKRSVLGSSTQRRSLCSKVFIHSAFLQACPM